MESSPFGKPVSKEQLDARNKQGIDDPEKAKAMAMASKEHHDSAVNIRKGVEEGQDDYHEDMAELAEEIAAIAYDTKQKIKGMNKVELQKELDVASTAFDQAYKDRSLKMNKETSKKWALAQERVKTIERALNPSS